MGLTAEEDEVKGYLNRRPIPVRFGGSVLDFTSPDWDVDWIVQILYIRYPEQKVVQILLTRDRKAFYEQGKSVPIHCQMITRAGDVLLPKVDITGFAHANHRIGESVVYLDTYGHPPSEDWVGAFLVPRTEE